MKPEEWSNRKIVLCLMVLAIVLIYSLMVFVSGLRMAFDNRPLMGTGVILIGCLTFGISAGMILSLAETLKEKREKNHEKNN
jgi:hypothetical protein